MLSGVRRIQERAIRSFGESRGYALLEVVSDAGVSGAKREKADLDAILEELRKRRAS